MKILRTPHTAIVVALADKVDALEAELAEAEENVERVAARSKEILADEAKYQAEIKRLTKERVDIGNRYDLHMADCQRRLDEVRGAMHREATARVRSMREAAAKVAEGQFKADAYGIGAHIAANTILRMALERFFRW